MWVDEVITEITQRCRNYGAQKIILFGSRAKDTATERSDLDTCKNQLLLEDIKQYGREIYKKIKNKENINMNFQFAHYNYNVMDLDKSIKFYEEALGLKEVRRKEAEDGSFILAYLGDGKTGFELELTWLRDWEKDHYDLGDNEIHLAFTTDDMEASHKKHEEMGCICFENPAMGIYFINDPDGYWLEIVPENM